MHRRALATYASATSEADDLIQRYGTLIDRVARRIVLRIGLRSAFDDLWSAGALGLLEAAGRFDASRGVSFETFVEHRIRGSMLDELRRMDHLPRRLRSRADDLQKAKQKLSIRLGREASTEEIAAELNLELDEISGIEALAEPHVSLEKVATSAASEEAGIEDRLARAQAAKALAAGFQELPERLQTVLGLHYLEGLTYREIAKMMDISEPRVCQLHADGLKKLRGALSKLGDGAP
ncbi:MAG TPA: FliA/WhiG family RNA polymerase sigma factor [Polyangia bacterium]|jgi:RNA polymerase sigma factor for flagellar operon FliA